MALASPSILITDDDVGFRDTLQAVFEPEGYHTILASDGEEALEIVRDREVHLALFDVHMPRLSGLEVLRQVKQFKALLPCILMSADWDDALVRQAKMLSAFSLLRKPVSHLRVRSVVQRALWRTYQWPRLAADAGHDLPAADADEPPWDEL